MYSTDQLFADASGYGTVVAVYDGQAPLVPWLIRVFQNKVISDKRRRNREQPLPEDELGDLDLPLPGTDDERWHEEFRQAARSIGVALRLARDAQVRGVLICQLVAFGVQEFALRFVLRAGKVVTLQAFLAWDDAREAVGRE